MWCYFVRLPMVKGRITNGNRGHLLVRTSEVINLLQMYYFFWDSILQPTTNGSLGSPGCHEFLCNFLRLMILRFRACEFPGSGVKIGRPNVKTKLPSI